MRRMSAEPSSRRTAFAWGLDLGATLFFELGDVDAGWHVRAGRWIWEHGAIPTVDPFSHTAEGPWCYTEAFAQLLLHGAHVLGAESIRAQYLAALVARRRGDRAAYLTARAEVARLARRRGVELPLP